MLNLSVNSFHQTCLFSPVVVLKNVFSLSQPFHAHTATLCFLPCVTAACSSTLFSCISEGVSHPISLQFSPEIGFELRQHRFILFWRRLLFSSLMEKRHTAVVVVWRLSCDEVLSLADAWDVLSPVHSFSFTSFFSSISFQNKRKLLNR